MSHFTIGVADPARTVQFYQALFEAPIQVRQGAAPAYGIGPGVHFLMFIGGGPGRGGAPPAAPRIDHACMAMTGFDPAAVTKTLTGYGLKPLPNASREPLVTYISLRMPNRGGAEGGTPELYFTDPDGLAIQLQDVTYCGGAGFLGDVCPPLAQVEDRSDAHTIPRPAPRRRSPPRSLSGQSKLPPDIDATSFSRLPPLDRAALDDDGKKIWDYIADGRAHARHGAGAGLDAQPRRGEADTRAQSVPAEDGRRAALLRAVGADRRARVRSAVPVVGPRAGRDGARASSRR